MTRSIEGRVALDRIRYANVWEDADLLCEALRPGPGRRFLSIASGGDNALALAGTGAEVVAADLSPAQVACTELKIAAIRAFEGEELLAFLGVREMPGGGAARLTRYRDLESALPAPAREYFAAHPGDVAHGIVHAGKFERYFRTFQTWVLPLVHSRRDVEDLLAEKSVEERRAFYARRWDNRRWRAMFRLFFSRFVMGRLGRDPEFFRYVEGSVADRILERGRYALTELPTHANPWLEYILQRNFVRTLPPYLRPDRLPGVRANLDRVKVVLAPIDVAAREFAEGGAASLERRPVPPEGGTTSESSTGSVAGDAGATRRTGGTGGTGGTEVTEVTGGAGGAGGAGGDGFDGFNLSDLFEYVDEPTAERIYGALLDHARPGARFAYWNMLAPRRCPAALAAKVRPLDELARDLHRRDLAFFYSAFVLEEVVHDPHGAGPREARGPGSAAGQGPVP